MNNLENNEFVPFDPFPAYLFETLAKRTHSSAFPESDSDSDDDDPGRLLSYAEELDRVLERSDWENRKKRKGRQGRSRESRDRAKRIKEETKGTGDFEFDNCADCGKFDFIEDSTTGDVICSECGLVQSSKGLEFTENILVRAKNKSKPYQRVVHFRQRYAQLVGKDPWISEELFEEILLKIDELKIPHESFGKKDFSKVLKELGRPETKRLSANWIQVRRRMGLESPQDLLEDDLYKRLCSRYQCIDVVFQEKLWSETGEKGKEDQLERRNIINVNYLMVQMLRLEDEELFKIWGKFFPQLTSKKQPGLNNARWKILTDELKGRFKLFSIFRTEERIALNWEFKELTKEDIELYCSGFH